MGTLTSTVPAAPRARLQFVDLLRGWAVIFMIQTHVLNATLRDDLRGGVSHQLISFIDGLVAPSFIFASGFVFALALRRKLPDYLTFGPALWKLAGRLLFVLGLGYMLHLPVFSLRRLLAGVSPEAWAAFWAVDVLQCIAVSLLLVLLLLQVVRTERRLLALLPWMAAGVVLLTPILWSINAILVLPLPLAAYVNAGNGSLFPLFPWSAFLLAGVVSGGAFVALGGGSPVNEDDAADRRATLRFAAAGGGVIAASFLIQPVIAALYPPHDYWRAGPSFVILRLGLVLLLLSLCHLHERRAGVGERSVVALVGRESLLVYSAHLMLIYGDFPGFSFHRWAGRSFGHAEALIATAALVALMILLAFWWDRVRRSGRRRMRFFQGLAGAGFLIAFLLGPE